MCEKLSIEKYLLKRFVLFRIPFFILELTYESRGEPGGGWLNGGKLIPGPVRSPTRSRARIRRTEMWRGLARVMTSMWRLLQLDVPKLKGKYNYLFCTCDTCYFSVSFIYFLLRDFFINFLVFFDPMSWIGIYFFLLFRSSKGRKRKLEDPEDVDGPRLAGPPSAVRVDTLNDLHGAARWLFIRLIMCAI